MKVNYVNIELEQYEGYGSFWGMTVVFTCDLVDVKTEHTIYQGARIKMEVPCNYDNEDFYDFMENTQNGYVDRKSYPYFTDEEWDAIMKDDDPDYKIEEKFYAHEEDTLAENYFYELVDCDDSDGTFEGYFTNKDLQKVIEDNGLDINDFDFDDYKIKDIYFDWNIYVGWFYDKDDKVEDLHLPDIIEAEDDEYSYVVIDITGLQLIKNIKVSFYLKDLIRLGVGTQEDEFVGVDDCNQSLRNKFVGKTMSEFKKLTEGRVLLDIA
jgi:hypothetical protein